ncbi:Smr/MutS family protein [Neisseriaceae bacterium CLB008]|nr:Smr/MutS family protein [Neisseriaceae bacterium]
MAKDFKDQLKAIPAPPAKPKPKPKPAPEPSFAQMVGAVTPLKGRNQYHHPKPKGGIRVRPQPMVELDEGAFFYVGDWVEDIPASHSKNGRGQQDLDKLLSGVYPIMGTLDLHGYTQLKAQQALNVFIHEIRQHGVCCRVVHGSGLGSHDFKPVLKATVRQWLKKHPDVLAFTEESSGNDGSVLVLLKKQRLNQDQYEV